MKKFIAMIVIVFFGSLSMGMEKPPLDSHDKITATVIRELQKDGNVHQESQLASTSLSADEVMTPFWRRFKELPDNKKEEIFTQKIFNNPFLFVHCGKLAHINVAAAAHAGLPLHKFTSLLDDALIRDNIPLAKLLISKGICKEMDEKAAWNTFHRAKTVEIAEHLLQAGLKLPRKKLCDVMSCYFHPDLVTLYRKHGANPLLPECDSIPQQYGMPETPFTSLMLYAECNDDPAQIIEKFNALTQGLTKDQMVQMITYGNNEGRNLMQELRDRKRGAAPALLQRVEQKLAEMGIKELAVKEATREY